MEIIVKMMKKICIVTAARSEYGLLRWLINDLSDSDKFELQLVVTGGHLLKEQGHTIDQIIADGYKIARTVDAGIDASSTQKLSASMGRMAEGFSECFAELKPDYLLVLGDRYELLPICSTAFVMRIPIIHLSGGDVTEGAIDDGIRNAVTMLATYHFPGTEDSRQNIIRMRGSDHNVWTVGEPGLDVFNRIELLTREQLAENLGIDPEKKWILMTYHSETRESLEYNLESVKNVVDCLYGLEGYQIVITYANADFGGIQINNFLEDYCSKHKDRFVIIPSLGQQRYVSYMKQVSFVIGNSSSGICEAPFLEVPVINIGDRQKGRYQCSNIIQCGHLRSEIQQAIESIKNIVISPEDKNYWGDGHTSERIESILERELL